jgi:hypothetical protein
MMRNRSVPVDIVLPHVVYHNLADAIVWLSKTLGLQEHFRYGEPLSGAHVSRQSVHHGEKRASGGGQLEATRVRDAEPDDIRGRCGRALPESKSSGRQNPGGASRHGVRRAAVRGRGSRWTSLAVFSARARFEPRGMGRESREPRRTRLRCHGFLLRASRTLLIQALPGQPSGAYLACIGVTLEERYATGVSREGWKPGVSRWAAPDSLTTMSSSQRRP